MGERNRAALPGVLAGASLLLFTACSPSLPASVSRVAPEVAACLGTCLTGRDPYEAGCIADATTTARAAAVDASGHPIATVELRWSARCGTAWARAVRAPGAPGALVANIEAVGVSSSYEHATDGEVWTDMVAAPRTCATATGGIRNRDGILQDVRASSCDEGRARGLALR